MGWNPIRRVMWEPIVAKLSFFATAFILVAQTGWSSALAQGQVPPSPPPQAVAAGYNQPVLNENFTNFALRPDGVSYSGDNGVVWGNGLVFYPPGPKSSIQWSGPNQLTLSAGGAVNTHLRLWGSGAGSTVFKYGYFEASIRLTGGNLPPQNWGSFWLFSAQHQEKVSNPDEWSEIDIFESGFFPAYSAVVHDHHYNGSSYYEDPAQNPNYSSWQKFADGADLTQWHTYGALWAPGKVSYYFDNVLMHTSTTNKINDSQPCSIILSAHASPTSQAQFRWVHVFH
jgi:hypothetical protein